MTNSAAPLPQYPSPSQSQHSPQLLDSLSSSTSSSSSSTPVDYSSSKPVDPHSLPSLTLPPSPPHASPPTSSLLSSSSSAPVSSHITRPSIDSLHVSPHSPPSYPPWDTSAPGPSLSSPSSHLYLAPSLSHTRSQPLPPPGRFPPTGPGAPPGPFFPPSSLLPPFRPMQQQYPPPPPSHAPHPPGPVLPYPHYIPQQPPGPGHPHGGGGPPPPTPPPRPYGGAPPAVHHHQASGGYSGFYAHAPAFGAQGLMLGQGYMPPQAQQSQAQAHQQAQQQAQGQQLMKQQQAQAQAQAHAQGGAQPFSPNSLQRLLNPHSSPHLSTPMNLNLGASNFPAAGSASATLSSDLLYVNQRYHDLLFKLQLHLRKLDEHHHHQHPVLIEDILRALRDEVNLYNSQQLHRLSTIKPEHLLASPLSSSLSSLSSVSASYLSSASSQPNDRLFCKPSRLISQFNKKPFKLLMVQIQRQYTSSKKELDVMREKEKEKLIAIRVRLMGAPLRGHVYFVAKDLCQLIHSRKGNVAKSVSQFNENEKARMPVLCPRSNGTLSTHSLTVLTIDGIKRLLTASRSPLAPHLLKWLLGQVEVIVEQGERGDEKVGQTVTVTFPRVERKGEVEVKEGDVEEEVQVLVDSDEEGGDEEGGDPQERPGDEEIQQGQE